MFSAAIESVLMTADASTLTEIFLYCLVAIFALSISFKLKGKFLNLISYTPTLLTTIGILGTFTGIVSGLMDFNTHDIDGSIGPLLEGLKTAFITSLAGMFLSIFYKILVLSSVLDRKEVVELSDEEIGSADIYKKLTQQVEGIQQLRNSICENDESSLTGQIKLLRSDITDGNKKRATAFENFEENLWLKLETFAEMMSKSATEQVIEALNSVIKEFNSNLQEQFGENFKQLNLAVKELVTWQENYKGQLADMKNQYDHGVQSISKTEAAITTISSESKNIPETMTRLKEVMEVNQHQLSELHNHLEAFKEIRDKAVDAVPEIRGQIEHAIAGAEEANHKLATGILESTEHVKSAITETAENYRNVVDQTRSALSESANETANSSIHIKEQFSDAISDINNHMRVLVAELVDGGKNLNESYAQATKELVTKTESTRDTFIANIEEMKNSLNQSIQDQATEHHRQAERIFAGLERQIEETLNQTGEATQKQVAMIDQTMGSEVEKVMQSMGSALASISGQFTTDYKKLVGQMSHVVNQKIQ